MPAKKKPTGTGTRLAVRVGVRTKRAFKPTGTAVLKAKLAQVARLESVLRAIEIVSREATDPSLLRDAQRLVAAQIRLTEFSSLNPHPRSRPARPDSKVRHGAGAAFSRVVSYPGRDSDLPASPKWPRAGGEVYTSLWNETVWERVRASSSDGQWWIPIPDYIGDAVVKDWIAQLQVDSPGWHGGTIPNPADPNRRIFHLFAPYN